MKLANGQNSQIVTIILKALYGSVIRYIQTHKDVTGEQLRKNIQSIFHVAPKASTLDRLIAIAQSYAEGK